jgi:hypothetical protein
VFECAKSGFGQLLVTLLVTQNLASIVVCQFQRAQSQSDARLFEAVKDGEATAQRRAASFTASNRHLTIE